MCVDALEINFCFGAESFQSGNQEKNGMTDLTRKIVSSRFCTSHENICVDKLKGRKSDSQILPRSEIPFLQIMLN